MCYKYETNSDIANKGSQDAVRLKGEQGLFCCEHVPYSNQLFVVWNFFFCLSNAFCARAVCQQQVKLGETKCVYDTSYRDAVG